TIADVSFVGGFARAGGVTVDEYEKAEAGPLSGFAMPAEADPLSGFAMPVMKHMNSDHQDSMKEYVQYLVGVEV
ncbi:hypothetical protein T484DRAFT_1791021, partial [Baffinella frigidus]